MHISATPTAPSVDNLVRYGGGTADFQVTMPPLPLDVVGIGPAAQPLPLDVVGIGPAAQPLPIDVVGVGPAAQDGTPNNAVVGAELLMPGNPDGPVRLQPAVDPGKTLQGNGAGPDVYTPERDDVVRFGNVTGGVQIIMPEG